MSDEEFEDDLEKLFDHGQQLWLLGAGASFDAKLPLMDGLTRRVLGTIATTSISDANDIALTVGDLFSTIQGQIGDKATIEGILDHLSDYASMARRGNGSVTIPIIKGNASKATDLSLRFDALMAVRGQILSEIRETIRWGYVHATEPEKRVSGTPGCSIVDIDPHLKFVDALFGELLAARERRLRPVEFFTTNYDTLIEDALSLRGIPYVDGFRGGAVGYWDHSVYPDAAEVGSGLRANVTKIHGSIDWALAPDQRIIRRRIGDLYPGGGDGREVLIYPQATKYEFVRREPFDSLFQRFRAVLTRNVAQVLFICGYGFGDEHVDRELEEALARHGSQLTVVAFSQQRSEKLKAWGERTFGERLYVLSEEGAWCGAKGPYLKRDQRRDWWRFDGMTALVRSGGRSA